MADGEAARQVARAALGEVTFEAAGQTWRLRFGVNALCRLEAEVEDPDEILKLVGEIAAPPLLATVRAAVWAGLFDNHPAITFEDAGELINHVGLQALGAKVGQAIVVAMPQPDPKARPRKAARRNGGRG